MDEPILPGIALILTLGIGAQWLAWRYNLPNVLVLLLCGLVAGPVSALFGGQILDPDEVMGRLLLPFVSLSVAIILFEGGLSLKLKELPQIGPLVWRLVSFGALITWTLSTLLGVYLLGLDVPIALLIGAILVVTGPTATLPLLRQIRPVGRLGGVLRWEAIVIDPIGAVLAVLVFEAIALPSAESIYGTTIENILITLVDGLLIGAFSSIFLIQLLKRYLIPDFLQSSVTLMLVVAAYTISNMLQHESGLLTVTVMGIILANQDTVSVKHIIEFKENLRVLLISALFIILSARVKIEDVQALQMESLWFLLAIIVLVRPISVFLSLIGSKLSVRKKIFLSCMAPRGIVAAAIASLFAIALENYGHPQAGLIVPVVLLVVLGTVGFYGLVAQPLARMLGVARPEAEGLLLVGGHAWARRIAIALREHGIRLIIVDTNAFNVRNCMADGLPAVNENVVSGEALERLDLDGIGKLLALTSNDEVNTLAALHFQEIFGRAGVFKLAPGGDGGSAGHARILFTRDATYHSFSKAFAEGAEVEDLPVKEDTDVGAFFESNPHRIPLFVLRSGKLEVVTEENPLLTQVGDVVLYLSLS